MSFIRKAICYKDFFEVLGTGNDFINPCYIDDCIEKIIIYLESNNIQFVPILIKGDYIITTNDLIYLCYQAVRFF